MEILVSSIYLNIIFSVFHLLLKQRTKVNRRWCVQNFNLFCLFFDALSLYGFIFGVLSPFFFLSIFWKCLWKILFIPIHWLCYLASYARGEEKIHFCTLVFRFDRAFFLSEILHYEALRLVTIHRTYIDCSIYKYFWIWIHSNQCSVDERFLCSDISELIFTLLLNNAKICANMQLGKQRRLQTELQKKKLDVL